MKVSVIGHPFSTIGMGEQMRACLRALRAVHVPYEVLDAYRAAPRTDPEHRALVLDDEVERATGSIRIFHINGDEIDPVLAVLTQHRLEFEAGANIIMPAWELPRYPVIWANQLRRFNEVWALSSYVQRALALARVQSHLIGQPAEIALRGFLPRRYFGIRESAFVLLHFLDLSSFAARKNTEAVIELYMRLQGARRYDDIQLVLKVKNADQDAAAAAASLRERVPDAVVIAGPANSFATQSLIAACDIFVSLHRAEGFGRGPAEAMFLGRLVLATGWSGNLDYMSPETALLVNHSPRLIAPGEYPHGEGQRWAEPDINHALELCIKARTDVNFARATAERGARHVRAICGNRSVGLRMLVRLRASAARPILAGRHVKDSQRVE